MTKSQVLFQFYNGTVIVSYDHCKETGLIVPLLGNEEEKSIAGLAFDEVSAARDVCIAQYNPKIADYIKAWR